MAEVSKTGVSKVRAVPPSDPRLGVATVLIGYDGGEIGRATILSSDLAVTTAEVANSARAKVEAFTNDRPGSVAPLMLVFPQFRGSPGVYPTPVEIQSVDKERGFGVLSFSGALPVPIGPGLLGTGEVPADAAECDILCYDVAQSASFWLSGRVRGRWKPRFELHLGRRAPTPIVGAPVFSDYRLVGIVASAPAGAFDPNAFGTGFEAASFVEVLSVYAMAQSEVTPAVRNLLPRIDSNPNAQGPVPTGMKLVQPEDVAPETGAKPSSTALSDAELWARMSPSSRIAVARAEGIRQAQGAKKQIHTYHLIAGLFPSWRSFFARAGVSEDDFRAIVMQEFGSEFPADYAVPDLFALPARSQNAETALWRAAEYAEESGAKAIWSTHLLYGVLSLTRSKTVRALYERGARREDIRNGEGPDGNELVSNEQAEPPEPVSSNGAASVEANPTPESTGDEALFARLTPSGRNSLNRADGMRRSAGRNEVHMEHLIMGLFDKQGGPTRPLLGLAKIDRARLMQIIRETVGAVIPGGYRSAGLTGLPPMSKHVREALTAAAKRAGTADSIGSRHLLYGVLSVEECELVQALVTAGVNRGSIVLNEEPDVVEPDDVESMPANPTPKVDSDLWSEVDRLGYEAYARTIASLITHKETKPPLTIGIKAPWGAGKTTLMKRVQHLLDGDAKLSEENRSGTMQQGQPSQVTLRELLKELKNSAAPTRLEAKRSKDGEAYGLEARTTVWFNAWKYQTSEQIWAGMAHCIISQITARMGVKERELFWVRLHARRVNADEVRAKVYEMIARQLLPLALVVGIAITIVIWVTAGIQFLVPYQLVIRGISLLAGLIVLVWKGWDKLGDKAAGTVRDLIREPDYEGKMGYLHLVESDIREVLQLATAASASQEKPEGNPLVVFVDDLDRCSPNKVAEVVEAINLFLCGDYPNCVFVIGMEPGMVAAALEVANKDVIAKAEEMGLVDRTAPVGWRFMEKIVQLPIMIPPPTEAGRRGYVHSLTGFGVESVDMTFVVPGATPITAVPVPISRPAQHGAEEEVKVQNYIKIIGSAKDASDAARKGEDVVARTPVQDRWAAREAGSRVYEQALTTRDPVMARFLDEVAQLVDGNPRQIKRYVNVFRFYSTLRHSLRLEGLIPMGDLPSDQVLAKFVALSIQWPHAVDCLRVKKDLKTDGRKVSLLELLETESKKTVEDETAADAGWEKFVGKDGLGMGAWAEKRAFREFLSRGESLCAKEGHGLW